MATVGTSSSLPLAGDGAFWQRNRAAIRKLSIKFRTDASEGPCLEGDGAIPAAGTDLLLLAARPALRLVVLVLADSLLVPVLETEDEGADEA